MANMVDAVCTAAMALAAHCRSVGVAIVSMLRRAVAFSTRRTGASCSASAAGLPLVGPQLVDPTVQLRRQPREHVREIAQGSCPLSLADCSRLITTAARSPAVAPTASNVSTTMQP